MQSTVDYSIKEGEKVILDIKVDVPGTGGLGAALRTAQKKTNEILTEVVERHRAGRAGEGDEKDDENENDDDDDEDDEEEGDEDGEPNSKKLKK